MLTFALPFYVALQDLSTKILLGLLVAGVWGLLLKPTMTPKPVVAQPNTKPTPTPTPTPKVKMIWRRHWIGSEDPNCKKKINDLLIDGWEPDGSTITHFKPEPMTIRVGNNNSVVMGLGYRRVVYSFKKQFPETNKQPSYFLF